MKAGFVGKFLNFVGLEEVDEEFDGEEMGHPDDWKDEIPQRKRANSPSLVTLPSSRNLRVVVMHPRTLEEGQVIADQVKNRRPVIVNLDLAEERAGQRLLNFLSGVAYAVDGGLRKVGENIFLITPHNVEVASNEEPEDSQGWFKGGVK